MYFLANARRVESRDTGSGKRLPALMSLLPWFALAILLSFLVRLPFLHVSMISDEGGYAYVAQRWFDGSGVLYDDIWVSRPQGIFVAYVAIMETLGGSTAAFRIGAWLFVIAAMPAIYAFARVYAGRTAGILAICVFGVVSASPVIEGFTANAEVFMATPCAIAAWLLLRAHFRRWPAPSLLLIGVLCAFAALLKPAGVVMIPIALTFTVLASVADWRVIARRIGLIMAGVAIGFLPAIVHGLWVGWNDFLFASVTYRIDYQSSLTVSSRRHIASFWGLTKQVAPLVIALGGFWVLRLRTLESREPLRPVSGGSPAAETGYLARARQATRRQPAAVLLAIWSVGGVAGMALGGDWWYHYLIQLAAPFSIWLAAQLLDVGKALRGVTRWAFVAATCFVLLYPFGVAAGGDALKITADIYPTQGYEQQDDVARYLRENGTPGAPMLVAFNQAALYYLADRPAAYRYMYQQELSAIPEAEAELIAIVSGPDRPEYVVDTGDAPPFADEGARFWLAVHDHYRLEAIVNGIRIYRALE
jgi:4-amino-4-deoxy-L-arabinose transferase-like glycosyltransferase